MGCLSMAMTGSFKQINWCFSEKLMLQKKGALFNERKTEQTVNSYRFSLSQQLTM